MATSLEAKPCTTATGPTLRLRLLLLSAVTIVVALGIAALALSASFERYLERRVAQELHIKLLELAGAFELDSAGTPTLSRPLADPRYEQPNSGSYWQIADPVGAVLRSRSLWEHRLAHDDPRGRSPEAYEITGPEGETLYVRERDVRLGHDGAPRHFRLTVALDHAELEALGASFRGDALFALSLIAFALLVGAWFQLALGLAPLRRLKDQVADIQHGQAARLHGSFPAEIAPLATNLNALIDRQEDSVRRARERAGDLAHGLKTPLAIIAAEARRLEAAGQMESAARLHEQIAQMRGHIERQLARARSHGASAAGGGTTDAASATERLLALMRRLPRSEQLDWRNNVAAGARLRMDPEDFGEVMGNLLDNARLWARGRIIVSATAAGNELQLAIDDDGPGIAPNLREALRTRGESSAPPGQGSGLGLAIVSDLLTLYGTTLHIQESPMGGCRMAFALKGSIAPLTRTPENTRRHVDPGPSAASAIAFRPQESPSTRPLSAPRESSSPP